jgi:hypothetical protein
VIEERQRGEAVHFIGKIATPPGIRLAAADLVKASSSRRAGQRADGEKWARHIGDMAPRAMRRDHGCPHGPGTGGRQAWWTEFMGATHVTMIGFLRNLAKIDAARSTRPCPTLIVATDLSPAAQVTPWQSRIRIRGWSRSRRRHQPQWHRPLAQTALPSARGGSSAFRHAGGESPKISVLTR